jgi:hypothetical protein
MHLRSATMLSQRQQTGVQQTIKSSPGAFPLTAPPQPRPDCRIPNWRRLASGFKSDFATCPPFATAACVRMKWVISRHHNKSD